MAHMDRIVVPAEALGCHAEVTLVDGRVVRARLTDAPEPATQAPSEAAREVAARLARHLETGREDFSALDVDLSALPPFHRRVLEALREVPPGRTVTYGELAARVGKPGAARAVGAAMAANPVPLLVPCHRVLPVGGRLGNYSGHGGVATKRRLLALESPLRAAPDPGPTPPRPAQ